MMAGREQRVLVFEVVRWAEGEGGLIDQSTKTRIHS
jgi:hypothetical protein